MKHTIVKYLATGVLLSVLLMIGAPAVETSSGLALPFASTLSLSPAGPVGTAAVTPELLILDAFDEWTIGGGYLYWATNCNSGPVLANQPQVTTDHYVLHRWPVSGGTPETIITASHTNCNTFRFLTADDDGVYFWNDSLNRLMNYPIDRAPGQGGTVVRGNIGNVATGLYLDNDNIYYATTTGRIRRVPKNGSSNNLVHDTGSFVRSMAVDTSRNDIYWIDGNGLWYGRKSCSSPPCSKLLLTSTTGHHIVLGATGVVPRTVYMVRNVSTPAIRSYDCQTSPCVMRQWYTSDPTVTNIGLPAWTRTGFALPKNWLIWPERTSGGGRLQKMELNPAVVPTPETRYSGPPNISLKAIIEGNQVYFASEESGNERIMRLPFSGSPPPRDFGNLSQVSSPHLTNEWKPIVRVESWWADKPNDTFLCTGTLIDPGIVITAGACVFGNSNGYVGWADSVRVIPAYEDGAEPFGDAYGEMLWAFDEFKSGGSLGYDIGWIKLDRPVGALTEWHDIGWQEDLFLWLSTFNNPGYPRAGFNPELMYNRSGQFTDITANRLIHTAEAANMKGSPALNLDDNTVYGIEARLINNGTTSAYARLTQAKVEYIQGIIASNTPTTVDLVPLKFRVPTQGGLAAGTWPTSESFVLHNYSTASTLADKTVTLKIYLSNDDTIDAADTLLGTGSLQIQGNLGGRETIVVPGINWDGAPAIPLDTPPGDYWLGIILDEADAVPANNATHRWDTTPIQILPPQMSVTPNVLVANAVVGDPPIEKTVTVDILGNGAGNPDFNWSGMANAAWLSINPANGGDGQEVTVTIDGSGLGPGTYHGQVNFVTDLQDGSGIPVASATVDVTLNVVLGEPVWQPEPAEMNFEAIAGGADPPSQGLIVKATVDYPFNWIVEDGSPVSDDASWLPVNSGAGTAPGLFNIGPDISGLAPGQYSTQLVTHSPGQNNYALTTVNLTIHETKPPEPILQVSPATLFYEATAGQPGPVPQTFAIANIGTGQLNWTASSDVTWLNLGQSGGSGEAQVSVSVSVGGLSPGSHVGQITVTDGSGNQQVVRAVLQLRQPPTMVIDGNYLVFTGLSGQASPPSQNFIVRNSGIGGFDWTAAESIDWLGMNPVQGSPPATVEVTADTTGLDPGSRQGNISISSPTALGSPQEIAIRLFLQHGPVLATAPQVLDFNVVAGSSGGEQKSITIANVSRGNMEWTAESNANWLLLGQTAGVTGAFSASAVNVGVNAANLIPRDDAYIGQITVRSGNGEGSPQTITVFLHVLSPARYCNIPNGDQGYVVNSRNAKIRFTNVQRTLTADGGCDFRATLRAALPQNASLQSQVAGHVDSNNVFIPTSSSPLVLKVAIFTLILTDNFSISDDFGLKAIGGQWKLPSEYGGKSKNFNGAIQINADGISLTGAGKFDIPDIDYGAMRIRQLQGQVSVTADWSYLVVVTGDLEIGVLGGTSIKGIELRLDQRGFRSGQIGTFTLQDVAGVDIEVISATFDSNKIRADRAILKIPRAWGGAEGALYGLAIDFDGNLSVTGGRFRLPSISVGGDNFRLSSLEGEFRSVSGGYEIQARGEFGMRGFGESGGCTLIVDVTIFSEAGASVLVIDSADRQYLAGVTTQYATTNGPDGAEAVEGIGLRELTLGIWDCQPGLPIGPTGFELTGVQGTVKLRSTLEEVSLKVQIQSIAKLGTIPFVSVEPQATLRPAPFFLGYEGPTFMTNIKISDTIGRFENRHFSAEMAFDFTVLHGGLGIDAGLDSSGDFYLGGNGWADVSVKKGSVYKRCELGLCVNIPPFSFTVAEAEAEVNLTHVFGSIKVLGYGVSFKYSFETGDFDLSRASLAYVITSQDIQKVRAFQQSGLGPVPAFRSQIAFADSESVILTLPVASAVPQAGMPDPGVAQLAAAGQSDALFILVQPVDGQLTFVLIDPSGQEYTPANLPVNIQFEQAIVDGAQQMVYSVTQAQPGAWQTRVEGDVNGTEFAVFETVNVAPGVLDNVGLTPTGNLNEVEVQWQHLAQEATPRIRIYANAHEITQTVTYTNVHGLAVTGITDSFVGEPVAEISNPPTDGRLETAVVDLGQLPSGSYAFWIEAQGIETPGVRCYIRQNGSGCDGQTGGVARFIVDHSSTFPSAWEPGLAANVAIRDGLLHVSWDASTHPDVDHYLLTVRGEGVLRPGQETFAEISVPSASDGSGRVTATLDNIEPGTTYRLTVKAIDEEGGRSVQSPELVVAMPQPDFVLTSPDANAIVRAGGEPTIIAIDLEMSSNLPYDPLLFVDYDRLPDGIYVEFSNESIAGRPTARGGASISAAIGLPPGHYAIPINARSGELERMLNVSIEVIPPQYSINLPLVLR